MMGERIRKIRKSLSIPQKELAYIANISTSNLCDIEKGRSQPSVKSLIQISKALGVSLDELVSTDQVNERENLK